MFPTASRIILALGELFGSPLSLLGVFWAAGFGRMLLFFSLDARVTTGSVLLGDQEHCSFRREHREQSGWRSSHFTFAERHASQAFVLGRPSRLLGTDCKLSGIDQESSFTYQTGIIHLARRGDGGKYETWPELCLVALDGVGVPTCNERQRLFDDFPEGQPCSGIAVDKMMLVTGWADGAFCRNL